MQFNSEANGLDLVTTAKWWCGIDASDTTTYALADMARNANIGMEKVHTCILKATRRWPHDDLNNAGSTLLDETINLASGTDKYAIVLTWMRIKRIRVKDSAGNWVTLDKVDRDQLSDTELAESGTPNKYFMLGNYVYPRPIPNYASTGGMQVEHLKGPSLFASTDTTKLPGFASLFHEIIAYFIALPYCETNDMEKRTDKLLKKIGAEPDPHQNQPGFGMLKDIFDHYSMRDEDEPISLITRKEDYGESALGGNTPGGRRNPNGF